MGLNIVYDAYYFPQKQTNCIIKQINIVVTVKITPLALDKDFARTFYNASAQNVT